jgi:hypothetical protein
MLAEIRKENTSVAVLDITLDVNEKKSFSSAICIQGG